MKLRTYTQEELQVAVDALKAADGVKQHAADALDVPYTTFLRMIKRASQRGLLGTEAVLPGFQIKQVASKVGDAWVKQTPEPGDEFEMPPAHLLKGVSALVDSDGKLIQQWIKTRADDTGVDIVNVLKEAFDGYERFTPVALETAVDADTITVYPVSDHHLGMYSWAEESGEDYDLAIAHKLLTNSMQSLVMNAPASKTGIVLNLGDFFHSDSNENRTRRSGAALDVDTRYAKVLRVGVDLMIQCIELALQKHEKVVVRCLPGNHDPYAALTLAVALKAFFARDERVFVDDDPSPFFWHRFGKVLIGSTHGDMIKATDMPGVMAAFRAKDWGETEHRYIYLGHVHHASIGGGEKHGATWETFRTLATKDAWHRQSGYSSGRSMVAITHHKDFGEVMRHTVSVKGAS